LHSHRSRQGALSQRALPQILAPGAFHPAGAGRVRDLHQIGRPPEEVFRLDEMVTLDGFHELAGEPFASKAHLAQCLPVEKWNITLTSPSY
ncbi:MAG TPA: hypothetical protein VIT91_10680, partial [Chthoniobacterales bacterium]